MIYFSSLKYNTSKVDSILKNNLFMRWNEYILYVPSAIELRLDSKFLDKAMIAKIMFDLK